MNTFFEWIILRKIELNIELNVFFSIIQRSIEFSISIANSIHATYFLCWNEGNEGDKIEHFHLALKSGNAANHPFLLLTLWLLHQVAIVRLTRMSQNTFHLQNYSAASFIWVAGVSRGVSPLDCHGCLNQHLSTNSFQFNQKGANFLAYADPCTLVDSISKRWFNPFCLIHCSALVQYCNVKDYPTVYKCDDPQWEGSAESGEFGVFKSPDHGWTLLGFAEPPLTWTCCWQNDFKPRSATSFDTKGRSPFKKTVKKGDIVH